MNKGIKKIKVLHVVHWPKSGIVSLLRNYFKNSKNEAFEYHMLFFIHDDETLAEFKNLCASVACLNYEEGRIRALTKYAAIIREISPDIIHTHSFQPGVWGRFSGIRTVSTVHSPYPYLEGRDWRGRIKKFIEISTINTFGTRIVCVSDAVKKHLLAHTKLGKQKLDVIKNGIPVDEKPMDTNFLECLRKELNLEKDSKVIVSTGRLSEEKGFDVLLKAFSIIRKDIKAVLLILGDGPLKDSLDNLASEFNVRDMVRFLGYKKDVRPYLSISDLYVCSSRFEGFGMSIIEALNAGLPVIASNVGGIAEVIKNGENGILTESENPSLLADAIAGFFYDNSKAGRFKESGFRSVEQFDIAKTVKRYEEFYNQCM